MLNIEDSVLRNAFENSERKLIFDRLLKITNEFVRVCEENNLTYSLDAGSLLGAVRHNGFIPWDDDMDIIMPRKDYNKLKELAKNGVFKKPYFFENPETEAGCPRFVSKLRDSDTTCIVVGDIFMNINQGIFIDIFPIDNFPNDEKEREKMLKKMKMLTRLCGGYSRFYAGVGMQDNSLKKKMEYCLLYPLYKTKILTSKKIFNMFENLCQKYNDVDCEEVVEYPWFVYDDRFHFPKKVMDNGFYDHPFEKQSLRIIREYDLYLTQIFGDYMTPIKAPSGHGELVQIVDIPYEEFFKEHHDELLKMWQKTIKG